MSTIKCLLTVDMIHILPKFLAISAKTILQRRGRKVEVKSARVEIYSRIPLAMTPLQIGSLQKHFNGSYVRSYPVMNAETHKKMISYYIKLLHSDHTKTITTTSRR